MLCTNSVHQNMVPKTISNVSPTEAYTYNTSASFVCVRLISTGYICLSCYNAFCPDTSR